MMNCRSPSSGLRDGAVGPAAEEVAALRVIASTHPRILPTPTAGTAGDPVADRAAADVDGAAGVRAHRVRNPK